MSPSLNQLFADHDGYLSDKWAQYMDMYERELARFVAFGRPVSLLEIGVQNGGSLQIWAKYLPAGSHIVGIDIDPSCAQLVMPDNVEIVIGNTADAATTARLLGGRTFDIVIDDGSHRSADVIAAFDVLFDRVNNGGLYVVEDLHCSYLADFGGGFCEPKSAIESFKRLVEALNADHLAGGTPPDQAERLQQLNRAIAHLTFYDSAVVVEKRRQPKLAPFPRLMSGAATPVADVASAIWQCLTPRQIREITLSPSAVAAFSPQLTALVADARQAIMATQEELAAAKASIATLQANIADMAAHLDQAERQRDASADDRMGLLRTLEATRTDVADLSMMRRNNEATQAAAAAELASLRQAHDLVIRSPVWRATHPFRKPPRPQ